jgi:predicted DsbA family dithiol-disulfide isomerase
MFGRGEDIGRVDVLVDLARALGLDATEAKAVLDVDRYAQDVAALSAEAAARVGEPPPLAFGGRVLRGFHNRDAVRTFLLR